MDEIIARSEASVRAAIRGIPDGVYTFEDFLDDFGPATDPLRVSVTVTVAGDGITVDYAGSSPQTPSGINSYINYRRSYSYAAVKCLTGPLGPMNEGALWHRLLASGRPVSEYGRLCRDDPLMLPCMKPAGRVKSSRDPSL